MPVLIIVRKIQGTIQHPLKKNGTVAVNKATQNSFGQLYRLVWLHRCGLYGSIFAWPFAVTNPRHAVAKFEKQSRIQEKVASLNGCS